jgi:hypothetical protein
MWEALNQGQIPYEGMGNQDVRRLVKTGGHPPVPSGAPAQLAQLLEACWAFDQDMRPSFAEVHRSLLAIYGDCVAAIVAQPATLDLASSDAGDFTA